jgi:hypothetical protein
MDALYAKYTIAVSKNRPLLAANCGVFIHIFVIFGVVNYTQDYTYIFPILLGSWFGTYFSVIKKGKKNGKN